MIGGILLTESDSSLWN